ncbi:MAG: DoxX-like family protein [Flavobacteriales bacterium]
MKDLNKILNYLIASVWLINGLFCKVMNLVPRHEQIVAEILGHDFSRTFTVLIGLSEVVMAIWIISTYKSRLNCIFQMVVIATMNTLEFIIVPDLLLWGKFNAFFAFIFIALIYFNEFHINKVN